MMSDQSVTIAELRAALRSLADLWATTIDELTRTAGRAERAEQQADELFVALASLLEAVDVVTLADPTHYEVANAVGLPALIARQLVERYRRTAMTPS
jgi:hypothetical protein